MSPPAPSIRSPLLALAMGLVFFALCSWLREALQPHLLNAPYLGALLTGATFVLAGALVGACSPRHTLLYGVILGVLAGALATWQFGHFSPTRTHSTLQVFATFAGWGIVLCEIGALAGRAIASHRPGA
jgi:Na+-translocating ferredoxin:NAD+ oxidoreductase RnfD subunit